MNNKIIYAVAGVLVLGAGTYAMLGIGGDNQNEEVDKIGTGVYMKTTEEVEVGTGVHMIGEPVDSGEKSIFEDYIKTRIGNLKCTLVVEEGGGVVNQIVYISGIRMRMDSTTNYQGMSSEGHIVNDGEYIYMWGSNAGSFKMKIDSEGVEDFDEAGGNEPEKIGDLEEILERIPENDCVSWIVDENMFELPAGVEYKDFSESMNFGMDEKGINDNLKMMELQNKSLENLPKGVDTEQLMESIRDLLPTDS